MLLVERTPTVGVAVGVAVMVTVGVALIVGVADIVGVGVGPVGVALMVGVGVEPVGVAVGIGVAEDASQAKLLGAVKPVIVVEGVAFPVEPAG